MAKRSKTTPASKTAPRAKPAKAKPARSKPTKTQPVPRTPAKKPSPAKKAAPTKKPARTKKPAPAKKAAPAEKAARTKKPAPAKKATPAKKPARTKQPVPAKPASARLSPALARLLSEIRSALSNPDLPRAQGAEVRERLSGIEDTAAISRLIALLQPGDPHDLRSAIIYKLEQFPPSSYFDALLDALPELGRRAPGWAFVTLVRIVNTRAGGRNSYASRFETAVRSRPADLRRLVVETLERHRHAVEGDAAENIGRTLQALAG